MTPPTTNPKLSGRLSKVSIVPYDSEKHGRVGIGQSDYADGFIDGQKELIKELEMAKYHQVQTILSDLSQMIQKLRTVNTYNIEGIKDGHYVEVSELEAAIRAYVGVES